MDRERLSRTFEAINPSTGEPIAEIAAGDAPDVDVAVAAARDALRGPWRRATPSDRQNVLLQLADLVDAHFEELRLLEILEMGSPIGSSLRAGADGAVETLRYYAGWATKLHGETVPNSLPGGTMFQLHPRAGGRKHSRAGAPFPREPGRAALVPASPAEQGAQRS